MAEVRSEPGLDPVHVGAATTGGWRALVHRAGWGIADQALSSLTNFALGILVARSASPEEFGAFTIVFATFILTLGLARAMTGEPLLVRHTESAHADLRLATASATGTAIAVGTVAGLACIVTGVALRAAVGDALIALGILLPWLLLQDAWRFAFFAAGRSQAAFANDLIWAALLLPALVLFSGTRNASARDLILIWGATAAVAAAAGIFQAHVIPDPRSSIRWIRGHRDLAPRYVGEYVAVSGAYQLSIYGVAAVASLAAVAALRAGQLLLGPLNVFGLAAGVAAVPEFVRISRRRPDAIRGASAALSVGMVGIATVWGSALLLLPARIGELALGSQWAGASLVLLPLVLARLGSGAQTGPSTALRARGAARRSLRLRAVSATLVTSGTIGGAVVGGALGAAWALAAAECLSAVLWWWQVLVVTRKPRADPAE
jgi:O-antigen/teichoic acid export membrane protein